MCVGDVLHSCGPHLVSLTEVEVCAGHCVTTTNSATCAPAECGNTTGAVVVPGLVGATQLALGRAHCALKLDGDVACWGDNQFGQLGDGTTTPRTSPDAPVEF